MLRVRLVGSGWTGAPSLNTFYFSNGDDGATGAQECADHVQTVITGQKGIFPSLTSWSVDSTVDKINPVDGELTDSFAVTGMVAIVPTGATFAPMPVSTAALLRYRTSTFIAGRRLRGHAFLSPLAIGMMKVDGTPATTLLASVNALGTALLVPTTSGDVPVVWHRPVSGSGGQAAVVTTATMAGKFAVLRSRRD